MVIIMSNIIISNISKKYSEWVLKDFSMTLHGGKIYGLVGRNGAGKTVLIKCICGIVQPTQGQISIDGKVLGKDIDIPESIGAIIEIPGFLPNISGFLNLFYLANLRGNISNEDICRAMVKVGLNPNDKKHVGKYSLGMKQRLGIAQAIMEDPQIIILDEPMNGLDIQGVADVKQLLINLRNSGKLIVLASHHREDIDEICDVVCYMKEGQIENIEEIDRLPI